MSWPQVTQRLIVGTPTDMEALLADAAAFGLARRGSLVAPKTDAPPVPLAPLESKVLAGPRVAGILAQIMATGDDETLRECCRALEKAGMVAPYRLVPDLLAAATARHAIREAVLPVLGTRGRWLACRRTAWSWAAGAGFDVSQADLDDVLDLPLAQRRVALAEARTNDPAGYRAFIERTWDELRRSDDRKLLIAALEYGLAPEDEPLLEKTLDDRSAPVREEAIWLLRALPGSALSRRAEQRLRDGLDKGLVLDIREGGVYDAEPDAAELRDLPARGTKSTRLRADASSVSPDFWMTQYGPNAPRILRASPWGTALLPGIASMLGRAGDPLPWLPELGAAVSSTVLLAALESLPPRVLAAVLIGMVGTWNHDELDHFCSLLPGPWPAKATNAVLDRFFELGDRGWRVGRPPEVLVRRGDLAVLAAQWGRIAKRWPVHGAEEHILGLRNELQEAIERRDQA